MHKAGIQAPNHVYCKNLNYFGKRNTISHGQITRFLISELYIYIYIHTHAFSVMLILVTEKGNCNLCCFYWDNKSIGLQNPYEKWITLKFCISVFLDTICNEKQKY